MMLLLLCASLIVIRCMFSNVDHSHQVATAGTYHFLAELGSGALFLMGAVSGRDNFKHLQPQQREHMGLNGRNPNDKIIVCVADASLIFPESKQWKCQS